jgi:hypothetical protein
MNNYLDNLTARSLGRGEQVWPRLPSLFEPGSSEPASTLYPDPEQQEAAPGQIVKRDSPVDWSALISGERRIAQDPRGAVSAVAGTETTKEVDDEQGSRRNSQESFPNYEIKLATIRLPQAAVADSSAVRLDEDRAGLQPSRGIRQDLGTRPQEDHISSVEIQPSRDREAKASQSSRSNQIDAHPVVGLEAGPAASELEIAESPVSEPQHWNSNGQRLIETRLTLAPNSVAKEREITTGPIWPRQAVSPNEEENASIASRVRELALPKPEPQSTIKVSIGRVEVRALFSDARPARPESTKASPRITLEEYLKQRNGGQR